jgi:hypothetical protein
MTKFDISTEIFFELLILSFSSQLIFDKKDEELMKVLEHKEYQETRSLPKVNVLKTSAKSSSN